MIIIILTQVQQKASSDPKGELKGSGGAPGMQLQRDEHTEHTDPAMLTLLSFSL